MIILLFVSLFILLSNSIQTVIRLEIGFSTEKSFKKCWVFSFGTLVFRKHLDLFLFSTSIYAIFLTRAFFFWHKGVSLVFNTPSRSTGTVRTIENGRVTVVRRVDRKSSVGCNHYRFNVSHVNCEFLIPACESNGGLGHKTTGVKRIR